MAIQQVDTTTPQPNGKFGETPKTAWEKMNANMTEIDSRLNANADAIEAEVSARNAAVSAEASSRAAADNSLANSISATLAQTGKNKFVNGALLIWQDGTSVTASTPTYGADQIRNNVNGFNVTMSRQNLATSALPGCTWSPPYFLRMDVGAGSTSTWYSTIQCFSENLRQFSGAQVTLSFWAKASTNGLKAVSEFTFNPGSGGNSNGGATNSVGVTTFNLTTAWTRYSVTVTVPDFSTWTLGPDNTSLIATNIWLSAGSANNARNNNLGFQTGQFDFAGIQLEFGATATNLENPEPIIELMRCMRYFEKSFLPDVKPANNAGTAGARGITQITTNGTLQYGGTIPYRVPKRTSPVVTFYNPSANNSFAINSNTGVSCVSTSVGNESSVDVIAYNFNPGSGTTPGQNIILHFASSARF